MITFSQFIKDFNQYYQTEYRSIQLDSNSLIDSMLDLYDTDDFEIDWDNETIELF